MLTINNSDFNSNLFPYPESSELELKLTFNKNFIGKYEETICGFLNSGGGKLIFGISDDLQLIGLNLNSKEIDECVLSLDNIIRYNRIVRNDSNLKTINPSSIKISQIVNITRKKFLIVTVISEENVKYQLKNGRIYFRLGASNLFQKTEKFYSQQDFDLKCSHYEKTAAKENEENIIKFRKIVSDNNDKLNKLKSENEKLMLEIIQKNEIYEKYVSNVKSENDELMLEIKKIIQKNEIYEKYVSNIITKCNVKSKETTFYEEIKNLLSYCFP